MTPTRVPGRLLAWTTLIVALAASIGANVAQARPEIGPRLTAAVAPAIVILASGLLERVSLAGAKLWQRAVVILGLIFVVGAAFVTSFQHQRHLLLRYGNDGLSAVLLPLAVDVLIVMASVCLSVIAERRRDLAEVRVSVADLPDIAPDMVSTDEQPQRGGKPLTPEQRAARLWRANPKRSAASIGRTLREAGVDVSDRQVSRWLEPLRRASDDAEPVTDDAHFPDVRQPGADHFAGARDAVAVGG